MPLLPASIVPTLLPFAPLFTAPTWCHVQVLVTGTLLAQGPRTVAAALRVMGLVHEPRFERDHRVLRRGRWSWVQGSQILLGLLMALLPPGWLILRLADSDGECPRCGTLEQQSRGDLSGLAMGLHGVDRRPCPGAGGLGRCRS